MTLKAPKRYLSIELEGMEFRFRLTIKSLRKLEESTGKTWGETMESLGDDPLTTFVDIVWAASIPFKPDFTKADAEDIYDALIDSGYDQADVNKFLMKIMQESGLFPKDKDVDAYMDEAVKEAESETKADPLVE